jgi:hypothetical protein
MAGNEISAADSLCAKIKAQIARADSILSNDSITKAESVKGSEEIPRDIKIKDMLNSEKEAYRKYIELCHRQYSLYQEINNVILNASR